MAELSERHEVRVRGKDNTVVFVADSSDGKLVIRQEWDGKGPKQSCSITLADPSELEARLKPEQKMGYEERCPLKRHQHKMAPKPSLRETHRGGRSSS